MPRYDYVSMGFITFDCLGWPFTAIPPGAGTNFIDELTLSVSGAAGTAVIAAAKMGLKSLAVGGVGHDLMGDWVLKRLADFGVDSSGMQQKEGWKTSSSIVTTRHDGSRPALHMMGATGNFLVDEALMEQATDTSVFHAGGVGLMKAMDQGRTAAVMKRAKERGAVTTVDIFASSPADLPAIAQVLPFTDYFLPSIEEAEALTGRSNRADIARTFIDLGAKCCVFTLGAEGAYYHSASGEIFAQPAFDVTVKCTCGCGDAFNAGFATGLIKGMDAIDIVRLAQAASALNATGLGSQAGIEDFDKTWAFAHNCRAKAQ